MRRHAKSVRVKKRGDACSHIPPTTVSSRSGLTGMAKALEEQRKQPNIAALSFEERLALLVDREATERENKRLDTRLEVRQPATERGDRGPQHEGAARSRPGALRQSLPPANGSRGSRTC